MIKFVHGTPEKLNCEIVSGETITKGFYKRDAEGHLEIEADFELEPEDGTYIHLNLDDGGHFEGHIEDMTFVNSNGE